MEIYDYSVPFLSLREVAEELAELGEISVGKDESIGRCSLFCQSEIHILIVDRIGNARRNYVVTIDRLRDIGIGGTATHVSFGQTDDGEDVLWTFMD